MDLDTGAGVALDVMAIPDELRHLVPLIQKWGFEAQQLQDEFVCQMRDRRPDEVVAFNQQIDAWRDKIVAWGRSIPELAVVTHNIDEHAWNHPYWSFLAALKMREITDTENSEVHVAVRQRATEENRMRRCKALEDEASELFRNQRYEEVVRLLEPYESMLSPIAAKKLAFSRRHN